jgi:hypothetical protein
VVDESAAVIRWRLELRGIGQDAVHGPGDGGEEHTEDFDPNPLPKDRKACHRLLALPAGHLVRLMGLAKETASHL